MERLRAAAINTQGHPGAIRALEASTMGEPKRYSSVTGDMHDGNKLERILNSNQEQMIQSVFCPGARQKEGHGQIQRMGSNSNKRFTTRR